MDEYTDGRTELLYQYPGCCHLANSMACHPWATFHIVGAATSWIQCHDPRTYHIAGWKYSIRHIENRFSPYFIYCFLNAVWALVSSGFRIVSDTLVCFAIHASRQPGWYLASLAVISPPATSLMPISTVSPTTDAHLRTRCRWSHWNVINWHRSSPGLLQKKQVPSTCFPLGRK